MSEKYHCAEHPDFVSDDVNEVCSECGNFLVDENGQPASAAPASDVPAVELSGSAAADTGDAAVNTGVNKDAAGDVICPHCQEPNEPGDLFCMSCGGDLNGGGGGGAVAAAPVASSVAPAGKKAVSGNSYQVAVPEPVFPALLKLVARFDNSPRARAEDAVEPTDKSDKVVLLDRAAVKVGRTDPRSQHFPHVALNEDGGMSRRHCQFVRDSGGNYSLVDTDSGNGTKLNGVALTASVPQPIKVGDQIQVGFWYTIYVESNI